MRADGLNTEGLTAATRPCGEAFPDETLEGCLRDLMVKCGVDERLLRIQTGLDKAVVFRALRGLRKPGRNALILMALALGCDVDETRRLLRLGGRDTLNAHYKRDAVILFCIQRKLTIRDCQTFLEKLQLAPLRE